MRANSAPLLEYPVPILHSLILPFSHSPMQSHTSGVESEATSSEPHEGTLSSTDRSPPSHPHTSTSPPGERGRGVSGAGGVARVDSGVEQEEWVSVQRKKKVSGEGRVRQEYSCSTLDSIMHHFTMSGRLFYSWTQTL